MPKRIRNSSFGLTYFWPQEGDTAFAGGNPSEPGVAALHWLKDIAPQWQSYAEGFRSAAERLGASVGLSSPRYRLVQPKIDRIALPLITLWRHYLELVLKSLIPELRDLPYGPEAPLPGHHNLKNLWDMAEPALAGLANDPETMAAVKSIVMEFHALDQTGQVFRYPVSKEGVESLPQLPETLDLRHLHRVMMGVAQFFYASGAGVDAIHEARDEAARMAAEQAAYC